MACNFVLLPGYALYCYHMLIPCDISVLILFIWWCLTYFKGPFKLNGVPLRRVSQSYVIATSTKIDVSCVDASKITDSYFKKEIIKKKKSESEFFEAEKEVYSQIYVIINMSGSHVFLMGCKCTFRKLRPFQQRRKKIRKLLIQKLYLLLRRSLTWRHTWVLGSVWNLEWSHMSWFSK